MARSGEAQEAAIQVGALGIAALAPRISESEATIQQISIKERDAHSSVVDLVIDVKGRIHLANVMRKIRNLKQVQRVYRTKN